MAKRLEQGSLPEKEIFLTAYNNLMKKDSFTSLAKESTADENTVHARTRVTTECFSMI